MTGIRELFAELSEPDYYDVSAQLELFVWRRLEYEKERKGSPWHRHGHRLGAARYRAKNRDAIRARESARRQEDGAWVARRALSKKEYVARKLSAGKCSRCSQTQADGKTMCERHLELERERNRRRAQARSA